MKRSISMDRSIDWPKDRDTYKDTCVTHETMC